MMPPHPQQQQIACTEPAHFVEFHLTRHRGLLVYGGTKLGPTRPFFVGVVKTPPVIAVVGNAMSK